MSFKHEELYLAENLDSLDKLALQELKIAHMDIDRLHSILKTIAKKCQETPLNQEVTYIFLKRYITTYDCLKEKFVDKNYAIFYHESTYKRICVEMEEIRKSLLKRYALKRMLKEDPLVVNIGSKEQEISTKRLFENELITCQQLFAALQKGSNVLLVDARSEHHYLESKMLYDNCINIPEESIENGQSANVLGKELASIEAKKLWNKRDEFDVIVLFHWNYDSDNVITKLLHLRAALVDWDINCKYKEPPVILKDGYFGFLDMYPTYCSNPHVLLSQKYNDLDDLLNIEDITYPTEGNNKSQNLNLNVVNENHTSIDSREVLVIDTDNSESNLGFFKHKKIEIPSIDTVFVDKKEIEINDSSEKLKMIIEEEKNKELQKARALKPSPNDHSPSNRLERPIINRATKPTENFNYKLSRLKIVSEWVGLKNIRNTCYMNTIIQCIGHLPMIQRLFTVESSLVQRLKNKNSTGLMIELSNLLSQLWSTDLKSISPIDFYKKVGQLEPIYKYGNHEDCMEFFLFLLNHLHEDCSYDATIPYTLTSRQRAWYKYFDNKNSIFMEAFYHEIRIKQFCTKCPKNSYKFEIESTFMLSIPDHDFAVKNLMEEYMADYSIKEFVCSTCKSPVSNTKEFICLPENIVIVLKRYKQTIKDGEVQIEKNSAKANFILENFQLNDKFYRLYAIALHSGNVNCGHYTAAALTSYGWFEFNDETVKKTDISDDAIKSKACAFFYSRQL